MSHERSRCEAILDTLGINLGDRIAVVLEGAGFQGVARGTFSGVVKEEGRAFMIPSLIAAFNGVPAGNVMAIDCADVAAVSRIVVGNIVQQDGTGKPGGTGPPGFRYFRTPPAGFA